MRLALGEFEVGPKLAYLMPGRNIEVEGASYGPGHDSLPGVPAPLLFVRLYLGERPLVHLAFSLGGVYRACLHKTLVEGRKPHRRGGPVVERLPRAHAAKAPLRVQLPREPSGLDQFPEAATTAR